MKVFAFRVSFVLLSMCLQNLLWGSNPKPDLMITRLKPMISVVPFTSQWVYPIRALTYLSFVAMYRCFRCHWWLLIRQLQLFLEWCSGWLWLLYLVWKMFSLYVPFWVAHIFEHSKSCYLFQSVPATLLLWLYQNTLATSTHVCWIIN